MTRPGGETTKDTERLVGDRRKEGGTLVLRIIHVNKTIELCHILVQSAVRNLKRPLRTKLLLIISLSVGKHPRDKTTLEGKRVSKEEGGTNKYTKDEEVGGGVRRVGNYWGTLKPYPTSLTVGPSRPGESCGLDT